MGILQVTVGHRPALTQLELGALLTVFERVFDYKPVPAYQPPVVRGTFILDTQKTGQPAEALLRFNLPFGPARFWGDPSERTSDQYCEESIDTVLGFGPAGIFPKPATGWSTGIYQNNHHLLLILEATGGRFLASFVVESSSERDCTMMILAALSDTLAILGQDDLKLQASCAAVVEKALSGYTRYNIGYIFERAQAVDNLYPAIRRWYQWFESRRAFLDAEHAPLSRLFFE